MTATNIYYAVLFALSFILTLIYIYRWHKRFDTHMTVVFVLIPITILAYFLMYASTDEDAAIATLKLIYSSSCYLPWMMTMCVAELCGVRINRVIRIITFLINSVILASVLLIGYVPLFYKSYSFVQTDSPFILKKEYGPMHTVYYIVIILYLITDLLIIAYSYMKKKHVSRRILLLLFLPIPVSVIGYFINRFTMT